MASPTRGDSDFPAYWAEPDANTPGRFVVRDAEANLFGSALEQGAAELHAERLTRVAQAMELVQEVCDDLTSTAGQERAAEHALEALDDLFDALKEMYD